MKILFVCSWNLFRSVSGHYCMQHYLLQNQITGFSVSSAGTIAQPLSNERSVVKALSKYSIDISSHHPRRLTQSLVDDADVIVAMGFDHQEFIKKYFKKESHLFNYIAYGKNEPVLDIDEYFTTSYTHEDSVVYVQKVVDHIRDGIPLFVKKINAFCK